MNSEVQTIEGKDLDECKEKLFSLFGRDYHITDSKVQTKSGFLGLGQKSVVKAWYTVKHDALESIEREPLKTSLPKTNFVIPDSIYSTRYSGDILNENFAKSRDEIIKNTTGESNVSNYIQVAQMQKDMTSRFKELNEKLALVVEKTNSDEAHPSISKIVELLEENEFSHSIIRKIKKRLTDELTLNELDDFENVQKIVVDWIGNLLKIAAPREHRKPHVIIIVGPTGVGKTTTIAKIAALKLQAAKDKKETKPRIFMLTIDNMRVGAKEQLQKYADIFGSPLDSAETPEEVKKFYDDVKDAADIILIDTSGFSPNDSENIGKMRKILNVNEMDADVYLAFDATKTASAIKSVMQNFEPFGYTGVIVTKCDETEKLGGVLSAVLEKNKSVAFIANGQKAHTNLYAATKQYFLKRLYNFKIDPDHLDDLFPEEK